MFVVRTLQGGGLPAQCEAFQDRKRANLRFSAAKLHVAEETLERVSLYDVSECGDATTAIAAIESGSPSAHLLEETDAVELRNRREAVRREM